ncbi:DUF445 family protein [Spirochaeta cellobiosiphila]|uniref:DUF445 family protein n=1 Tax=Spirochaeta cellobiosiphila TaxID=504483 RepID=UPI000404302E|nr:DUF445 family protein [Spirochaeta cellobiosiphila]
MPVFRSEVMSAGIFALSGAVTNWLAVYMLFEKVPFLYGSGVIPLHFEEFKSGIQNLIMNQFFSEDNIRKYITEKNSNNGISSKINDMVDQLDFNKLFDELVNIIVESQLGSMLSMFGGSSVLEGYRAPFIERSKVAIKEEVSSPETLKKLELDSSVNVESLVNNVENIVKKRLDELTPLMVKNIIQNMIRKHLGWLVLWGGLFGGLIGLVVGVIGK